MVYLETFKILGFSKIDFLKFGLEKKNNIYTHCFRLLFILFAFGCFM